MTDSARPILLATRGSPLALAQAETILGQCRAAFPAQHFALKIIKTTGDKLQSASMAKTGETLPKGLFTKELEVALLAGEADLAVHSLKDLPTDLPRGLELGAVSRRADVRDVLVYRPALAPGSGSVPPTTVPTLRGFAPQLSVRDLPPAGTVATSSTRRKEQLLSVRPDLNIVEIRGNVGTRLQKVATRPELDATILAAAGLARLGFQILAGGDLVFPPSRPGEKTAPAPRLLAAYLEPDFMLPCVGQAAIGLEVRAGDERTRALCEHLNDRETMQCVTAERAFLRALGGGCQSPVAAYAEVRDQQLRMRAVSFRGAKVARGEMHGPVGDAEALGMRLAAHLAG